MLFHNGEFRAALDAGLKAGPSGINAANKASCMYATYLEPKEQAKVDIFMAVAARAQQLQQDTPDNPMPGIGRLTHWPIQPGHQRCQSAG